MLRINPFVMGHLVGAVLVGGAAGMLFLDARAGLICAVALLAGVVASFLDASRRWCDPGDHLVQGHALWHVLSALSLPLQSMTSLRAGPHA